MVVLSEAGLYFFLNRSDKPGALPMQKWVEGMPINSRWGLNGTDPPPFFRNMLYRSSNTSFVFARP